MEEIYLKEFEAKKVNETLDEWGVCVVQSHFTEEQATKWKDSIVDWLCAFDEDLRDNWKDCHLPYGPRWGMMQSAVSHCPEVWEIRERCYPLFRAIWGEEALLTSIDGATIHPPRLQRGKDWPHIDQTVEGLRCVQGQVVLSTTTASFRCTPQSHHQHLALLDYLGKRGKSDNWAKLTDEQVSHLQPKFEHWQIPIPVPAGSLIFWLSSTIHSAQRNEKLDDGWRAVVYVCQRPERFFTKRNKTTLKKAALEGRTTNHWGTRLFPKRPGHYMQSRRSEHIETLTESTEKLVIEYSPLLKKLTAQEPWNTPPCKMQKRN